MAGQVSKEDNQLWSLSAVSFGYDSGRVVDNISLNLEAGRCYGILGPNGSGKTTLLDLLSGVLRPQAGSILFQGSALQAWSRQRLAKVMALVPQDFMVRFGFSVRDVVEMGLYPHLHRFATPGVKEHELVEQVLAETGIAGLADRQITQLSGGEKQRAAVARALVQQPEVLLLDEATSNLDIHHSLEILQLIRNRFERHGMQVVAVLHDLNLAAFFCDELIFLKQGQVVCQGRTGDVLNPDVIESVYGVQAQVRFNGFSGCQQVSFRLP